MKRGLLILISAGLVVAASRGEVNIPPGYYFEEVYPRENGFSRWTSINNRGDIVWSTGLDPNDSTTNEIFLYREGIIEQITNDNIRDDFPSINDAGAIVWSRAIGPNGVLEIVQYRDGDLINITDQSANASPSDNFTPEINSAGHIVFSRAAEPVCGNGDNEIWFFDGIEVLQITDLGYANQYPQINDYGDIAWVQFNFCNSPWTSRILLNSNKKTVEVTSGELSSQRVAINNNRLVTWGHRDPNTELFVVEGWQNGLRTRLDNDGRGGRLNNNDQLVFIRSSGDYWELIRHDRNLGQSTPVAVDPDVDQIDGDINDVGEIAWQFGRYPNSGIAALLRYDMADLNCDHAVTAKDIQPFILALVNSNLYQQQYPLCDPLLADFNNDGFVTVSDIGGFVGALSAE